MAGTDLHLTTAPIAQKGMLIRKPIAEVFRAFVDPAITTKFWFTKSSGKLAPGARVRWDWEMFGVSADVAVKEVQENGRILIEWGRHDRSTTVELRFVPTDKGTYVQATESGFTGTGDEVVAHALDSTGGFSLVLAAAKALLEHDIALTVVLDHAPIGVQL
jgi:uncharacterized protein YndB with AHSA1/START domain